MKREIIRYVPTFESHNQFVRLLLESPDSLMIGYADKPSMEFTTGKEGYTNAFPFFVIDYDGIKNAFISDVPESHGAFELNLRQAGTSDAQKADDAGRIFIFDDPKKQSGFAVLSFYTESETSKSIDREVSTKMGTFLFIKKGPLEKSTIDAVAEAFKDTHPNYKIYLEDPQTKKLTPLLGSPEFGEEEYNLAVSAFEPLKAKQDKLLHDIEMGTSDVYSKPKPVYYKQSGGGLRDA